MRSYELMTIHRPDLSEDQVRSEVSGIEESLKAQGADLVGTEFWGKRRFAYEIDHMREGFYSVLTFAAVPGSLNEVDRTLSLADSVVRHKFVRLEKMSQSPDTKRNNANEESSNGNE